ncbi:MAG: SAM-dependent methyltransferase [Betaproteobacteria bacterium]
MRLLAALCLAVAAHAAAQDGERPTPFVTTPEEVVERMLALAGTRAGDVVMDLGSGDGRIVIMAAQKFGARGIGVELDERLVQLSRDNARRAGVGARASFEQGDVLAANIARASVVTVYLLPELMGKLQSRFVDELAPGTRIVSHSFTMAGWPPDRRERVRIQRRHPGQGDESALYLWVVPAEVRGLWQGDGLRVRIEQSYQRIDVEGATNARLSGRDIAWDGREGRFRGRVEGKRIVGELVAQNGAARAVTLQRH